MIVGYFGRPGSGKTYFAMTRIISELKRGRPIYTNIDGIDDPICREQISVLSGYEQHELDEKLVYLTEEEITRVWEVVPDKSVLVIDEAQNYFNSRTMYSAENAGFNKWTSKHRHSGNDLIIITQDVYRLDSAVRSLIEWSYVFRKIGFLGALVKNTFQYFCYTGEPRGEPAAVKRGSYNRTIYLAYMSYVTRDIREQGIKGTQINILRNWRTYAIPICLIGLLWFGWDSSWRYGEFFPGPKTKAANLIKAEKKHIAKGDVKIYDKDGNLIWVTAKEAEKRKKDIPLPQKPVYDFNFSATKTDKTECATEAVIDGQKVCYD